jgi:hypothetical protein
MAGGITNGIRGYNFNDGMFNDNGLIGTVAEFIEGNANTGAITALDFNLFPEKYIIVDFIMENLNPSTGGSDVHILLSDDGGATFKTGATDYRYSCVNVASGTANDTFLCTNSNGDSKILVATNLVATGSQASRFTVRVMKARATGESGRATTIQATGVKATNASGPPMGMIQSYGKINSASFAINAIRFIMSSGNVSVGYVVVGYRSV